METHEFWGRHFPGFRGLPQHEKERRAAEYAAARPDLAADLEAERAADARLKDIIAAGPYSLGSGDTELSRVFAWRFWFLLGEKGRFGVVLPRQAILSAPGMAAWRREILDHGAFDDVCLLTNNRQWIFDDVHPQYTIAMTTVQRDPQQARGAPGRAVSLNGRLRGVAHVSSTDADAIVFGGNGFRTVGTIAALEEDLGRSVLTANQVLLWAALRMTDADAGSVSDYGRLFSYG